MSDHDVVALRALAVDIAREAGDFADAARSELGTGRRVPHDTKSSAIDPVTEFDRATEKLVVERLRAERPDDSIVGEEGADHTGSNDLAWHVDPIDGTVNYVYDLPGWCTSVAVLRDGEPLAGAVYAPRLGDGVSAMFSAARGEGATLGDRRLSVSDAVDLSTSLVATGFSYHRDELRLRQADRIAQVLPHVRDIRRMGSAALDLAFVAAGRLDAYFEEMLNSWDVAAGVLLVTEAGGVVTSFDESPLDAADPHGVLASGHGLYEPLAHRLRPTR